MTGWSACVRTNLSTQSAFGRQEHEAHNIWPPLGANEVAVVVGEIVQFRKLRQISDGGRNEFDIE